MLLSPGHRAHLGSITQYLSHFFSKLRIQEVQMIGITVIFEKDEARLASLAQEGANALDQFTVCDLDVMQSLDIAMLCGELVEWHVGEPAVLLEDLVVVRIAPEALTHVLHTQHQNLELEQQADLEKLRAFVAMHGKENLWEFATF